jgi:hypothetical protein
MTRLFPWSLNLTGFAKPEVKSLSELLQRLADSRVDFVVVGGFAGVLHGSALVTRDLDICTVLTPENIENLREMLKDLNPRHRMTPQKLSFLQVPKPGESVSNLYLQTDWGVVDILSSITGVGDFESVRANSEIFDIAGKKFRLISLPDLVRAKESLGREKDILAAKELRAISAMREKSKSGPELEPD